MSNILDVSEGKIAIYAIGDSNVYVDVVFHDENFWMTQRAIAELFDTTVQNVGQHISRIFEDEELTAEATIKKIFIVQKEGKREVKRNPDFYSLDMIIAVGYRVNSKQADAALAVCNVFAGQPFHVPTYMIDPGLGQMGLYDARKFTGFNNVRVPPSDDKVLANIQAIQRSGNIKPFDTLEGRYKLTIRDKSTARRFSIRLKGIFITPNYILSISNGLLISSISIIPTK